MFDDLHEITSHLLHYCVQQDWAGYDPYDGLNSRLFKHTPLYGSKLFRLVIIQSLKRLPINLRPILLIDKARNPKALALFLSSLIILKRHGFSFEPNLIHEVIGHIKRLKSSDVHYWAWGYSFPWQTRTVLVPRGYPNLVCTVFVGEALLDAFDFFKDESLLNMSISAAEYIVNELFWHRGDEASFSYPLPHLKENVVHNANFLAAAFLCRIYSLTQKKEF